jgi:molybdate transport system permease protein
METSNWGIIWFTLAVSLASTLLILPPGVAIAWLLAHKSWPGKTIIETAVMLPLVLPPVATGLILLNLFGRRGPLGGFLEKNFGLEIVFTWRGVLVALAVMSFPLLVRASRIALAEVNPRLEQVARTLGATPFRVFFTITLPLAFRGILGGAVLAFSRALGEFGATMLVAGAIPGKTATLSVTIYNLIQLGHDAAAARLVTISLALSFGAVLASELLARRKPS